MGRSHARRQQSYARSPHTGSDLLIWLVKKGILEMHGSKKGAYYADASKNMDESE
jgi:hypothetical protein